MVRLLIGNQNEHESEWTIEIQQIIHLNCNNWNRNELFLLMCLFCFVIGIDYFQLLKCPKLLLLLLLLLLSSIIIIITLILRIILITVTIITTTKITLFFTNRQAEWLDNWQATINGYCIRRLAMINGTKLMICIGARLCCVSMDLHTTVMHEDRVCCIQWHAVVMAFILIHEAANRP